MDDRYGNDRGRGRYQERGDHGRQSYGRGERDRGGGDRGFMERAGEEVRSWFGGDDDDRGRQGGDRDRGRMRSNQDENTAYAGRGGTSGGWGNQDGESWNRDRPGTTGSYGAYGGSDYGRGRDDRRDERSGGSRGDDDGRSYGGSGGGGARGAADTWEGSGFGGPDDNGRRFDRVDPGHVGGQGAHPMSSPVGGGYGGGGGVTAGGGYSSSARAYAAQRQQGQQGGGHGRQHDPHYSEWRNRQIQSLDKDYDEYRREHQSKFEQDFGNWRTRRGEQRQHMGRVTEHMEVFGSDGEKIGVVDKVAGDRIILTRNDENAGGHHHSIPCSWIDKVEDKVSVNKTREEAMREWRDEENNRALFDRDGEQGGSDGPHVLNRSFSGTY